MKAKTAHAAACAEVVALPRTRKGCAPRAGGGLLDRPEIPRAASVARTRTPGPELRHAAEQRDVQRQRRSSGRQRVSAEIDNSGLMNSVLNQLRREREARATAATSGPEEVGRAVASPERPEASPERPAASPEASPERQEPERGARQLSTPPSSDRRLRQLKSRRRPRSAASPADGSGESPAAPERGPTLAGVFGLGQDGPEHRAAPASAPREPRQHRPTADELGFAATLEAALPPRSLAAEADGAAPAAAEPASFGERRSVGRPRPTAAELGFSGDLASVLASAARPRREPEPEPEPEPEQVLPGPRPARELRERPPVADRARTPEMPEAAEDVPAASAVEDASAGAAVESAPARSSSAVEGQPAWSAMDQDSVPFPMGGQPRQPQRATPAAAAAAAAPPARQGSPTDGSRRPTAAEQHAADWEALARHAGGGGGLAPSRSRSGLPRFAEEVRPGARADYGNLHQGQPQHPEWVLPRRSNAAVQRARPGRRRQSGGSRRGASQSEQGTAANEAAGVALAALLESSGEWTYEQLIALDDGVQRDGLSYSVVRDFERRRCGEEGGCEAGAECAICLEAYRPSDWRKVLPCGHEFHEDCILHWFKDHTACPMCRCDCRK